MARVQMEAKRELKTAAAIDKENVQTTGLGVKRAVKPSRIPVPTTVLKSKPPSSHPHSSHPHSSHPTRTLQPKQAVVPRISHSHSTHPHPHPQSSHSHSTHPHPQSSHSHSTHPHPHPQSSHSHSTHPHPQSSHSHTTHPHTSHSQKTPTPKPSHRRPPKPAITTTPSNVKPVPNFRKLHKEWNKKLEKKKEENKTSIQMQPFAITPFKGRGGNCDEDVTSPEELRSPFEVDHSSMKAIFSEPQDIQSHRATNVGGGKQQLPGKYALAKTPLRFNSSSRLSFYHPAYRRNTVCNARKGAPLPGAQMSSESLLDGFIKLLERTTLSRDRSKAATSEGRKFTDIKCDLGPQFAQAEGKTTTVQTSKLTTTGINPQLPTSHPHSSTHHPPPQTSKLTTINSQTPTSHPHSSTHHPPPLTSALQFHATHETVPVTAFYHKHPNSQSSAGNHGNPSGKSLGTRSSAFEPVPHDIEDELCLLQDGWPTLPTAGRPECRDPVAETLMKRREQYRFIPISTCL